MSSEVEISNNALLQLGESTITSFDDDSKKARLCKRFYPDQRDATLRAYPWRCAVRFQALNQLSGADALPDTGFTYTYQLPASPFCLRALQINNDKTAIWQVYGRKLVTDEPTVTLKYIARITDPGDFDSLLVDALASRLAAQIAYPVGGNPSMAMTMWKLYQEKLAEARAIDSMEGTMEEYSSDDLIEVR